MEFLNKTRDIQNLNDFLAACKIHNSKIQYLVKIGDDNLRFTLSESLTIQEDLDLDVFIAAYADVGSENAVPKIYSIAKSEAAHKHFHNINYKKELTQSLIPKRTVMQGEVTKVDWYKSLDANMNPIDKVIKVEVVYNRDATGFATSRITTRTWINDDETENPETKITDKLYFVNPSGMIDEGLKRRKLLVNSIQIPTMTFMMEVLLPLGYNQSSVVLKGRSFMDGYESDFNKFVDNSSSITDAASPDFGLKTIVVKFRDEQKAEYVEWLDKSPASLGGSTTIRQYLISEFSI